jgi:3-phosphoshikimate 1-carboxyvinyltransferase
MVQSVRPSTLAGSIAVPASKSHTIRAILLATLAEGKSRIHNALDSADARSCLSAAAELGAAIEVDGKDTTSSGGRELSVVGTGGRLVLPAKPIDVGNSGTTLYFTAAIAALGEGPVTLTGDSQIQARPAENLLASLRDLGAEARSLRGNGSAPFLIRGPLEGGRTSIECPTSQYLSSLLVAAPLCPADVEINVPLLYERPYAEMTLRWLDYEGIAVERRGYDFFKIRGGQKYRPFDREVPGDFSSATFFLCAAAITGSRLTLTGLDMDDAQGDKEVVRILERMGCTIAIEPNAITIEGGRLKGLDIDMNAIPDALPAMAAAACCAVGVTRLLNVPQARLKETDRIAVMAGELSKMGASIEETADGLVIRGGRRLAGTAVNGHGDHRVVMALAVAGLAASGETTIGTAEAAAVTYPEFFNELKRLSKNGR